MWVLTCPVCDTWQDDEHEARSVPDAAGALADDASDQVTDTCTLPLTHHSYFRGLTRLPASACTQGLGLLSRSSSRGTIAMCLVGCSALLYRSEPTLPTQHYLNDV